MSPPIDGVLVVDKPQGPTSHDVVSRIRRTLRLRAVGHAGTLDPMATGVLVVAIGEATKLVPYLTAHDKAYEATVLLGVETDTLDAEGREVRRVPPSAELVEAIRLLRPSEVSPLLCTALEQERGRTLQIPPAFSAIRTEGERAFKKARRGEIVELAARPVSVLRLDLVAAAVDPPSLTVGVEAAKGYFVRSLGRDLAEALGTVGHLTALRRTRSGCFDVAGAIGMDASADALRAAIEPLARAAARALPSVQLSEVGARDARHGRPVMPSDLEPSAPASPLPVGAPAAWFDREGQLVAVGQLEADGRGRVLRGFAGEPASLG
jgi:tRNA pseudouridine55 synthase